MEVRGRGVDGGITNYQKINVWRWRAGGEERGADRRGQAVGGMKIGTTNSKGGGGGWCGGCGVGVVGFTVRFN